jgi:hypothetical protein
MGMSGNSFDGIQSNLHIRPDAIGVEVKLEGRGPDMVEYIGFSRSSGDRQTAIRV